MYIMINNVIGEKTIDLSYTILSSKEAPEVTIITMLGSYHFLPHGGGLVETGGSSQNN